MNTIERAQQREVPVTRRQLLGMLTSSVVAAFLMPVHALGQAVAGLQKPLSE